MTQNTISEADILSKVITPTQSGLPREVASAILDLRFDPEAESRIRELLQKNSQSSITDAERLELEKYLRVGTFLDLMKAKAEISLRDSGSSA